MTYNFLRKYIEEIKKKDKLIECTPILSKSFNELNEKKLLFQTNDDSFSLYGKEGELMHSKIGCVKEAERKFVIPSNIKDVDSPYLLDLCSGLGYNSAVALKYNKNTKIDMVELYEEVLFVALCIPSIIKEQDIIKKAIFDYFKNENNNKNENINIYVTDARNFVKNININNNNKYDFVFHDAFSPLTDPTLYTSDFLEKLFEDMTENAVLISYSSSLPFRAGLIEVGFGVENGPSIGRKRGITIARKNSDIKLSKMERELIAKTKAGMHYRDPELKWIKEKIFAEREERIKRNIDVLESINKIKKVFIKGKKSQNK